MSSMRQTEGSVTENEWDKADKRQTRNFQRKYRHFQPHSAMKGAMKAHSNPIATIPVLALRLQIGILPSEC